MSDIYMRKATIEDAQQILDIYQYYIKNTTITFEYEVPSLPQFQQRIKEISTEYPYYVCIIEEKIVGYVYGHRQMERAAYQWNAELSVYVDKDYLGLGLGRRMYLFIMEILKLQNIQNVYALVTYPNDRSEKLHKELGFELIGRYHKTGYKHGQWIDVMCFEKCIGDLRKPPLSVKKIDEIDEAMVFTKF